MKKNDHRTVIAIDGQSGSGKGTLARLLGKHYALPVMDTGLLYRAVAFEANRSGVNIEDAEAVAAVAARLVTDTLDERPLRDESITEATSKIAAYPKVRQALLTVQRNFAARKFGAILDGRDIGTAICPDATAKLYVVADLDTRAKRRLKDMESHGSPLDFEATRSSLAARDSRDSTRSETPAKKAEDAFLLDTTNLSIEEAFRLAVDFIDKKRKLI